jgi:hypothetical protein
MLDQYSPYRSQRNALFRREIRQFQRLPHPQQMRQIDFRALGWLVAVQVIVFLAVICALPGGSIVPLAIIIGLQIAISVGADFYTLFIAISLWHARRHDELWDALRLTMLDEEELIDTVAALVELRAWRALQIDSTQRVTLTGIAFMMVAGMVCMLPLTFNTEHYGSLELIFVQFALIAFALIQGSLYLRAPLWRFRATVMIGFWVAEMMQDVIGAMFAGIAVIVGLRLAVSIGLMGLIALYYTMLGGGFLLFGLIVLVLAGVMHPLARQFYARLREVLAGRTIRHMFEG